VDDSTSESTYVVDQEWLRKVAALAGFEWCVPMTPEDIETVVKTVEADRVRTLREADGIARNLARAHDDLRAADILVRNGGCPMCHLPLTQRTDS
jgi:hypothetical protein